jgi:collagen type IV alpha-3-binding protein
VIYSIFIDNSSSATLDSTKIIEVLDPDTVVFFQLHKRVWPAAQRDSCFWSHIRSISNSDEDQPTWLVVNYTTPHPLAPVKKRRINCYVIHIFCL